MPRALAAAPGRAWSRRLTPLTGLRCRLLAATLAAVLLAPPAARADIDAVRLFRAVPQLRGLTDARGRLPLLVRLPPGVHAAERGLLPVGDSLGAIHLPPSALLAFGAANADLQVHLAPLRQPLIDVSGTWTRVPQLWADTGLDGTGVVIGFIDTGLDVAHPDFRRADGSTRVAWMLRRAEPLGLHPELEAEYGCSLADQSPCAIQNAADIDQLLAQGGDQAPRDPTGHGTHVASVAAGNGGLMQPPAGVRFSGLAPGATIIVAAPFSAGGGFSDPDILNAARFVFDRADDLGLPAVLNVSLGSDYGPHDGTSDLEKGLAALVGDGQPGRVIVVAAGNSGGLYEIGGRGPLGVHTEAHVSPYGLTRVPLSTPGQSGTINGSIYVWITFRPGDAVSVGLEGPAGDEWIGLTDPGEEAGYESDDGQTTAAVINNLVNDKSSLTADTNSAVVALSGDWPGDAELAVLLSGRGDAQLWVAGTGSAAPRAFVGVVFEKAIKAGTIAVPASHPELLAVGCTLNRRAWSPLGCGDKMVIAELGGIEALGDSACYFSGAGPTPAGLLKPEISAPGALVAGAMSRDADPRTSNPAAGMFHHPECPAGCPYCYVLDDGHALTSGTSMAAPHVAGGAALLLQREPTLTQAQVIDVLQAGAEHPRGHVPYDYQIGAGRLNLLGAMAVLEERLGSSLPVDPDESYFVLSSPYLRPDPSWAVTGTVELRHEGGAIASGLAGDDLSLHVEGGIVTQPLTHVRAGMWRFAVSAPAGSGGTYVVIDVRFKGKSLGGARTLPVGVDIWAATSQVQAVGGCSVAGSASAASWLLLLAAALLLGARRRRAA